MADPIPPATSARNSGGIESKRGKRHGDSGSKPRNPPGQGSSGGTRPKEYNPAASGGHLASGVVTLPPGKAHAVGDGGVAVETGEPRRPVFQRQSYAAIDLGTNNCRLLIARPSGENFVVIDAFSRVVRLGEGLAQTGRLSDTAMDRAMAALRICADKLMRRNVHLARSVATEA